MTTERICELVTMLAEEAAEVGHAACKVLRHGPNSYHPDDAGKTPNIALLRKELIDLIAVVAMIEEATGALPDPTDEELLDAMRRKLRYAHHQ